MRAIFTHLTGSRKGATDEIEADKITVGRAPDNTLCFEGERRVSSHHAEIRLKSDHFILHDLGSTNGTMINGRRVVTTELHHDDLIEFGAGGPLVRFAIEGERAPVQQHKDSRRVSQSTVERIIARALRSAGNTRLIAAIVIAMLAGAGGGILLSSRAKNRENDGYRSFVSVAERNAKAVVYIRTEFELLDSSNQVFATEARAGSGFVISKDGLIITNRHLIRDWEYNSLPSGVTGRTKKIEVIFPGQRRDDATPAAVFRLSNNKETDVAVLKIEPPLELPAVEPLDPELENVNQGEDVAVIGYPLGLDLLQLTKDNRIETSLSVGVVSRVSQDLIQLHIRAYQGNSGGPVLNRRGQVIGILTLNVRSAQDITFCTPIGAALKLVKEPGRN